MESFMPYCVLVMAWTQTILMPAHDPAANPSSTPGQSHLWAPAHLLS